MSFMDANFFSDQGVCNRFAAATLNSSVTHVLLHQLLESLLYFLVAAAAAAATVLKRTGPIKKLSHVF